MIFQNKNTGENSKKYKSLFFSFPIYRLKFYRLMAWMHIWELTMDKRAYPRSELTIPITFTYNNAEIVGETLNVSINGLFVKAKEDFVIGSLVKLSLQLEKDKSDVIECFGIIIRKTDIGVGIQIESMELQSYIKWRNFVTKATHLISELEQETPTFVVQ